MQCLSRMNKSRSMMFFACVVLMSCSAFNAVTIDPSLKSVMVIKLPNDLHTILSLSTEEKFDRCCREYKDTISFDVDNFDLELGEPYHEFNTIDIRTKVILIYSDGTQEKLFIGTHGRLLYQGQIYVGSTETKQYFRRDE
jgi:hypothetical protein